MHLKVFLFLASSYVTCSFQDINVNKKSHETYCHKWKNCVPDSKKVCGYDGKVAMFVTVFNDLCLMYEANCKNYGLFISVDMLICETENEFINTYNDILTSPPYHTIKARGNSIDIPILELKNNIEKKEDKKGSER